jgi:3-oxoacyl-[acyl-carrier-protein] synthase II
VRAHDMIVAAAGGERDEGRRSDHGRRRHPCRPFRLLLNERLTNDLRPTLFLAQLSNLLAGNISIVHSVTGSSRTLMGEEGAGVSALATAVQRGCALASRATCWWARRSIPKRPTSC